MKIEDLLSRPEGKTLEFKQDLSAPKNILKTVVVFANTAGGIVLIGVEDGTRAVLGIPHPLDDEERFCSLIADSIEPRLAPDVGIVNWKGRSLLMVEVYPSSMSPHWLKALGMEKGVLMRVGSTNRQVDGPLRAEMRRSALNLSYDEEPMPDVNPEALDFRVASALFADRRDWNEGTAETLNLLAFIEKAGTGILRMLDSARAEGYPEPEFSETGFFSALFRPIPAVSEQDSQIAPPKHPPSTPQVGTKSALSRHHDEEHEPHMYRKVTHMLPSLKLP